MINLLHYNYARLNLKSYYYSLKMVRDVGSHPNQMIIDISNWDYLILINMPSTNILIKKISSFFHVHYYRIKIDDGIRKLRRDFLIRKVPLKLFVLIFEHLSCPNEILIGISNWD